MLSQCVEIEVSLSLASHPSSSGRHTALHIEFFSRRSSAGYLLNQEEFSTSKRSLNDLLIFDHASCGP